MTSIDLAALNLPLFNPDDEESFFPQGAKFLKAQLVASGTCRIESTVLYILLFTYDNGFDFLLVIFLMF